MVDLKKAVKQVSEFDELGLDARLHHIAVLVYDPTPIIELFLCMNWKMNKETYNQAYGVRTHFITKDATRIEFFVPEDNERLMRQLKKRGNHLHHLAFEVEDIEQAIGLLSEKGYGFIGMEPQTGIDDRPVIFMDPLSSKGILIELIGK